VSVDVLSEPESCDVSQLNPSRYGVIVESGWRRGLLLPDLEGVETVDDQVAIAKSKAGIRLGEPVKLSRFTVERHL
jgi:AMMECR1 domain-containing protein